MDSQQAAYIFTFGPIVGKNILGAASRLFPEVVHVQRHFHHLVNPFRESQYLHHHMLSDHNASTDRQITNRDSSLFGCIEINIVGLRTQPLDQSQVFSGLNYFAVYISRPLSNQELLAGKQRSEFLPSTET